MMHNYDFEFIPHLYCVDATVSTLTSLKNPNEKTGLSIFLIIVIIISAVVFILAILFVIIGKDF